MAVPHKSTQQVCQACLSPVSDELTLRCTAPGEYAGNEVAFLVCSECGFVFAAGNTHAFDSEHDFDKTSTPRDEHGRVGTASRPGREFFMAVMAREILLSAGLPANSILVYGAGLSRDHEWLSTQFPDSRVCVADLHNFQEAVNFVPIDGESKFDIVVACEVVEHFTDLAKDFHTLLSKASPTGLVVLSTNISDGTPLERLPYPFVPGHTAYYSGRSLSLIAKRLDPAFRIDFRPPRAALAHLGPRKRYVLMHRDGLITPAVASYFSMHLTAPSEEPVFPAPHIRLARWVHRQIRRRIQRIAET